ncbi:MAG: protein kinase [Polyangiaceae bacterium]|nr:protein kinase [Polyangiaceae bacterium]
MVQEDELGIVGVTLANAFHVERVVAHGGFAIVYRGIHGGFRVPIALKCLRIPSGMTPTQHNTFLEKFREEGELLFRLSAAIPEVVRPLHIDAVVLPDGQLMPFLALEWLEGEGLDQVITRTKRERGTGLDLVALVDMLRPVAHALSRAHNFPSDRGSICIVHRDLKPENLFLCQVAGAPAIKILDYGIAEVVSVAQRVSGSRAFRAMNPFTPGYGAPEQWAPDRFGQSGAWTDVWGLAITMAEALLGKPAIDGELEQMRKVALDPRRRPTPRSLGCNVSNDVEAVFLRALAVDPRERTQDIATFWGDLERAVGAPVSMVKNNATVGRLRRSERELPDTLTDASIDLDLAVPPESLRAPPRVGASIAVPNPAPSQSAIASPTPLANQRPSQSTMAALRQSQASMPAVRPSQHSLPAVRPSQHSMPAVRPSQPSMAALRQSQHSLPAVRPDAREAGVEADLRTHDTAPNSQAPPSSGTRSVRPGPISVRGARELSHSIPPILAPENAGTEPEPVPPNKAETSDAAVPSVPASPIAEILTSAKTKFRLPGALLAAAIVITVIDLLVVRSGSDPISLGPVRSFWVAGPLAVVGALLLVWKIVSDD